MRNLIIKMYDKDTFIISIQSRLELLINLINKPESIFL